MKRTVDVILNKESGECFSSEKLLGKDKIVQFKLRHEIEKEIQKNNSKYVCAVCFQKIKLRAGEKNIFHFAHLKDSDDCPIKTDTRFTKKEWLSIYYHGAKESERHIKLKNMLYEILKIDNRFNDVKLEKTVKEIREKIKWKKPDIQCLYNDNKYIFEIQLSHTFLSVIVAREIFYEKNEMPLIWIFDRFIIAPDYIKAFQGDIFAHNNCNVMVLDSDAYSCSLENKKLYLKIFWMEPCIENRTILSKWKSDIINFENIFYDKLNNRAYYYDYDRNLKLKRYELKKELVFDIIRNDNNYSKNINLFHQQINDLSEFNLQKWDDIRDVYKLYDLFRVLLSIKEKRNYGYKNQNIIWLLNIFYNSNKELYWLVSNYITNTNFIATLSKEKKYLTFVRHNDEYLKSDIERLDKYTDYTHWFFPEINKRSGKE